MTTRRKNNRLRAVPQRSDDSPPLDNRSPLRRVYESGERIYLGQSLIDRCGTIDNVEALTSQVLPPDPFDWSIVPAEDRAVVEAMLGRLEHVCEEHLDREYFTVVKRLIEVAVTHPENPLRSRTSPDRLAAALLWIALVANMDRRVMTRNTGVVWWWFDVTSCTRLARKLATTLGFRPEFRFGEPVGWDEDRGVYVRDSALLTSRCRKDLIAQRECVNKSILEGEERQRLRRPMVRSGNQVRMRLVETDYALAARTTLVTGRQVVVLGLGGAPDDPDQMFAFSIPEARRLLEGMQCAIDSLPLPTVI